MHYSPWKGLGPWLQRRYFLLPKTSLCPLESAEIQGPLFSGQQDCASLGKCQSLEVRSPALL